MMKKGFTLIELLIVVSIIGILVSLGTARYLNIEKSSRDLRRKSDLNQYRTALENYANANDSIYPTATGEISNLCDRETTGTTGTFKDNYLSGECLEDVLKTASSHSNYLYFSNGVDYVLSAKLEKGVYYEICSNGRSGEVSAPPTNIDCDL
jgi:prepilin-type N-terminal cleavage/methylation domain-containing protein